MLVELRGIQKKYGKSLILDNIDLSIPEGEALAIIGGNGTGKSTLLKIIAGFIPPTAGTLQRKEHIQIGYVPEHFPEGIRFTLEDYLYHLGHIHGLSTKYLRNKIPMLFESFHLHHAKHYVVRNFSKGMKQKTGTAWLSLTFILLITIASIRFKKELLWFLPPVESFLMLGQYKYNILTHTLWLTVWAIVYSFLLLTLFLFIVRKKRF